MNLEASIFHEATPEEEQVPVAPDYNYNNHHLLLPSHYCHSLKPYSNFVYPHELLPYDPFMYENNDRYESLLPCPKRQKYLSYDQSLMMMDLIAPTTDHGFMDGNNIVVPSVPEFYYDEVAVVGNNAESLAVAEGGGRKKNEKMTVSAQSVAARERRRRITEKTQELGRLVPGGSKMNTAEMLQAAAKYVNYLNAQVGMLQLINTLQEDKVFSGSEEMRKLIGSTVVEEKMYMEEKCFVPKEFIMALKNHKDIQSTPSILNDLNQFIPTGIKKEQ
ncbi:transcription factor bHLH52-like [Prosopis cineraria]|uniref:transcription factor bHLH52-like n=1 Tax=Prosopis cineraria TaxID=364024 RepID=UPI0024101C61|nr:transcription factor bHLH52-like [Prosopis cineraria]